MKYLISCVAICFSAMAWAADGPSQFVNDTLAEGQNILKLKDDARIAPMCELVSTQFNVAAIGDLWLGDYATISTDQSGVTEFRALVPSFIITRALPASGGAEKGTFEVEPDSTELSTGVWEVRVTVRNASGNPYNVKAIVTTAKSAYKVFDIIYGTTSALDVLTRDFQRRLKRAETENPTTPVTDVVNDLTSSSDFIRCP